MKLLSYLRDKGKFLIFYLVLMTFLSSILMLCENGMDWENILYVNTVGIVITGIFLLTEYIKERAFYLQLVDAADMASMDTIELGVKPGNLEQKAYLDLLNSLQKSYHLKLGILREEKKEHQEFILSWIHEVKLPIAASRLVIDNSSGKTVDYLIDKWEDELSKIDNYVEQALYYSRIDSFSNDYFITDVELNRVVRECIKKHAKIFINKRISVNVFHESGFCNSDSKWLAYILDQIVSNSLKYTKEGGAIRFEYEEDRMEKRLKVRDNGVGIAKEDIGRVFEKGFTGSIGRNYSKSTGIGLYLAKKMAVKLGHDLSIQSEEGKYTCVTIHFPKIRTYHDLI